MAPYLPDPFRGTVERRVLRKDETTLSLELRAAQSALAARAMTIGDIDLIIVSSFMPDYLGVGNAAYLARELGATCPAWNLESACSGSVVAFHTACGLVQAGHYRNVLVGVSCVYSRIGDEQDTFSWFLGDGCGAFIVGPVEPGHGLLGLKTITTVATCGALSVRVNPDPGADQKMLMVAMPHAGKVWRHTVPESLRMCSKEACRAAGVDISDIDFFILNTANAWFAEAAANFLEVDPSRIVSLYPQVANIGSAIVPVNLHAAALARKVKPGDLILMYSVASVATASAVVARWGDVALGPRAVGI